MSRRQPREVFFATCAPGLEGLLHRELQELRLSKLERQVGGVRFEGVLPDAWRVNLWSRVAIRVLLVLTRFTARDEDELYRGVGEVDWSRFLGPEGTLQVKARSKNSALRHTRFLEQRVKDGVVDQFRARTGRRPSVSKDRADLLVHVHLFKDRATLSADTSGESLHKRGWRRYQGRAPLSETLAAGMILLSGWDRRSPLLDPFCGSGTLLVEAALLACGRAPGLFRSHFGFESWPEHDSRGFEGFRNEAAAAGKPLSSKMRLLGWDVEATHVENAQENLIAADLQDRVVIERGDVADFSPRPGWNAWVVTNPPYGERVGEERDLEPLYRGFGEKLRGLCSGYSVSVLCGNPRLLDGLGLDADESFDLSNGGIDCRLLRARVP